MSALVALGAISAIRGEKITKIQGEWVSVVLDANLNEVSRESTTVTDYPVEDGSNIADNAIDDPEELQIDGIISNTPANLVDLAKRITDFTYAEDAYEDLRTLRKDKELVTITSTARTFGDMMITRLMRVRNPKIGDAVQFSMTARQIRKVKSSVAEVPLRAAGGKGKKKNLGTQPKKTATPEQNISLLEKVF